PIFRCPFGAEPGYARPTGGGTAGGKGCLVFSPVVSNFWDRSLAGTVVAENESIRVTLDSQVPPEQAVGILTTQDAVRVCLHPDVAAAAGLDRPPQRLEPARVLARLQDAGIRLNGADHLHYYSQAVAEQVSAESDAPGVRELTAADADLFAAFTAACAEDDLDEAYVELDHWLVVGALSQGALVAAASAYVWQDSALADVGVITHPEHRRQGYARAVVRAISRRLLLRGYQPQYRCFHTNTASAAVAVSAGMGRFGTWDTLPED